jgi:hypothetical protein
MNSLSPPILVVKLRTSPWDEEVPILENYWSLLSANWLIAVTCQGKLASPPYVQVQFQVSQLCCFKLFDPCVTWKTVGCLFGNCRNIIAFLPSIAVLTALYHLSLNYRRGMPSNHLSGVLMMHRLVMCFLNVSYYLKLFKQQYNYILVTTCFYWVLPSGIVYTCILREYSNNVIN